MTAPFKPIVTASVATQIADSLQAAIVAGELKVDDRLPSEEDLARRFGVSRPTIREALKRLAAQNLVRSRRGPTGGTFVNGPSREEVRSHLSTAVTMLVGLGEFDLLGIAEARHQLEMLCVRLAAQRIQSEQLDIMEAELAEQRKKSLSDVDFCASDVRFHRALVDGSQNEVLQFLMVAVIEALQPVANLVVFKLREREIIVAQHERIYRALRSGDGTEAEGALSEQMTYLRGHYIDAQRCRSRPNPSK